MCRHPPTGMSSPYTRRCPAAMGLHWRCRWSGRSSFFHPKLGSHVLAHDELLDLAGHRHRELVHKPDMPWHLVVRDLVAAELAHFLRGQRFTGPQLDPGAQFLAIALIRNAEHLHVLDLGMPIQEF